jgi:hypothetical protein
MKRVEWVEDSDVRRVCAQGIEGVGAVTRTCTASSRPGACRRIISAGFVRNMTASSYR